MVAVAGGITQATDITALAALTTGRPLVRLVQQAAQSMPANATAALTFGSGSEDIDTHNIHDPASNTSRITPTVAGYYRLSATLWLSTSTISNVNFQIFIAKNSVITPPGYRQSWTAGGNAIRSVAVTAMATCNGSGDYFEAFGLQGTAGAINTQVGGGVNSVFEAEFLRPL